MKGLSDADAARIDAVRMIYEISKGMAYLHEQGVLHGDLKVRIPPLKADSREVNDAYSGRKYTCRR